MCAVLALKSLTEHVRTRVKEYCLALWILKLQKLELAISLKRPG
jgi:hypothetical protein